MVAIYLMIIFYITNAATAAAGGAAAFTYLALGGLTFFIPCVIATAQLGVMFPNEGSLYNWTHKAFGGYWSFFVAFCAWFPGVLVMIVAGDVIVVFLQGLNSNWLIAPWQQGLVIVGIIAISALIAVQRFRMVTNTINMVAVLIFIAVVLLGLAGIAWLAGGHPMATSFSHFSDWNINLGNISLFGLVTLAYLGIESPLNMGGEIAEAGLAGRGKRKIITGHLLWGTLLVFIGYFVATFADLVAMAITAIMFFIIPYVVQLGGPANLSTEVYNVTLAASTLVWAFSTLFLFINLMKFYLRDPKTFNKQRIFPRPVIIISVVLGSLSCILAFIGTLFFSWIPSLITNDKWWYIIGGLTVTCLVIAAIGSMFASSEAAWEELSK